MVQRRPSLVVVFTKWGLGTRLPDRYPSAVRLRTRSFTFWMPSSSQLPPASRESFILPAPVSHAAIWEGRASRLNALSLIPLAVPDQECTARVIWLAVA